MWFQLVIGVAVLLWSVDSFAQPVSQVSDAISNHQIGLSFGWRSSWVVELGYLYNMRVNELELPLFARLGIPFATQSVAGDFVVGVAPRFQVVGAFAVDTAAQTGLAIASDSTGFLTSWVGGLTARPGLFWERGSVAVDLGWRGAFATHIKPSPAIERAFEDRYSDGADGDGPYRGWIAAPAGRFMVGLAGGLSFNPGWLHLAAGWEVTPQKQGVVGVPPIHPLPFYIFLSSGLRW